MRLAITTCVASILVGVSLIAQNAPDRMVTRTIDDDTLVASGVGTIRVIGIDAPEMGDARSTVQGPGFDQILTSEVLNVLYRDDGLIGAWEFVLLTPVGFQMQFTLDMDGDGRLGGDELQNTIGFQSGDGPIMFGGPRELVDGRLYHVWHPADLPKLPYKITKHIDSTGIVVTQITIPKQTLPGQDFPSVKFWAIDEIRPGVFWELRAPREDGRTFRSVAEIKKFKPKVTKNDFSRKDASALDAIAGLLNGVAAGLSHGSRQRNATPKDANAPAHRPQAEIPSSSTGAPGKPLKIDAFAQSYTADGTSGGSSVTVSLVNAAGQVVAFDNKQTCSSATVSYPALNSPLDLSIPAGTYTMTVRAGACPLGEGSIKVGMVIRITYRGSIHMSPTDFAQVCDGTIQVGAFGPAQEVCRFVVR